MKRKVFYSFHYKSDAWRTNQVRNIGVIAGNEPVSSQDWEAVEQGGDAAIKDWINKQLRGCSCTIVLVGAQTSLSQWVRYEIIESWNQGKGVVGIYIHRLEDQKAQDSPKGRNPFEGIYLNGYNQPLSSYVVCFDPGGSGKECYKVISDNLTELVEDAIRRRHQ